MTAERPSLRSHADHDAMLRRHEQQGKALSEQAARQDAGAHLIHDSLAQAGVGVDQLMEQLAKVLNGTGGTR